MLKIRCKQINSYNTFKINSESSCGIDLYEIRIFLPDEHGQLLRITASATVSALLDDCLEGDLHRWRTCHWENILLEILALLSLHHISNLGYL
jgi:hypothetical protein